MWANSISKGVSRERGGGFTVTEMTLEFRTVVFLGDSQWAMLGSGAPGLGLAFLALHPPEPASPGSHCPPPDLASSAPQLPARPPQALYPETQAPQAPTPQS